MSADVHSTAIETSLQFEVVDLDVSRAFARDLFEFFLGYLDELILLSTRHGHDDRGSINVPAATASFNMAAGIRGTVAMKR